MIHVKHRDQLGQFKSNNNASIELIHVKHNKSDARLLANTEAAEHLIQHILWINLARDTA